MRVQEKTPEKGTIRITVENSSNELENALELKEVERAFPDSLQVIESTEVGAEILPHIPFKEIADLLGEREVDIKVRFCNLVLNGEAYKVTTRRMQ